MKAFPYVSDPITVTQDMCDHNKHMNVTYYYKMFDSSYTSMYIDELGFTDEYMKSGFSTFTLEDNIRYLKEFRLGEKVYPSFYLNNVNNKMLHFIGILLNEQGDLSAIFETVLGHIDMNARRMTHFSDDRLQFILNYKNSNKIEEDLPFEAKLKIKDL
jgi:acyl-CoA thioesterase FadM|tara:strand:- start:376 stop:849 length:474 start_codon:yes stop_codon:yes gene_type:complete